jgi:dTDP-4-dehydrorhamnose reductase
MRILVIGANGMIGSAILNILSEKKEWNVFGSVRNSQVKKFFSASIGARLQTGVDVNCDDSLMRVLHNIRPEIVINCAGLTKHKPLAEDPLVAIPINTLTPHRLATLCKLISARFIHISTDCVFSGKKGGYKEDDFADARDIYGKSKQLGEVHYPNSITLRTSTIGHELESCHGLLDWFLSQQGQCKGFAHAVFSGLPTVVFAEIIRDIVIPHPELSGLYHIGANPINKFDLLMLISKIYDKKIDIVRDEGFVIDRSLDATRFRLATGYIAPQWPDLIKRMYSYQ